MHDIRAIRENPEAFDAGLKRRGLAPCRRRLLALDERRRAVTTRLQEAQERRNEASKEIGQAKAAKDEDARAGADGRGRRAEGRPARPAKRKSASSTPSCRPRSRAIPNLPAADVPTGRTRAAQCRAPPLGTPRAFDFAAEAACRARRGARPDGFRDRRRRCPARASSCLQGRAGAAGAGARAVHARSCRRASTATPKRRRRCWCATRRCSAPASCRSSPRICSGPPTAAGSSRPPKCR